MTEDCGDFITAWKQQTKHTVDKTAEQEKQHLSADLTNTHTLFVPAATGVEESVETLHTDDSRCRCMPYLTPLSLKTMKGQHIKAK